MVFRPASGMVFQKSKTEERKAGWSEGERREGGRWEKRKREGLRK